ncbi:MAG: hypothetical protein C0406_01520 [Sideroxydans sp.]|nr:hypothetical protein [Sideroxydans sp.]
MSPSHAEENAQAGLIFSGTVTPKLFVMDQLQGTSSAQFLERYDAHKGEGKSGAYFDADLNVVANNGSRNMLELERQGFGVHNHRSALKVDTDTLGATAYYTNFRTSTGSLGFLYNPNLVAGGTDPLYFPASSLNTNDGYVAQFNNDSPAQTSYKVDRATYGAGLALKPQLTEFNVAAALNFDGYERKGNRFATYVAGGSDVVAGTAGNARALQRWRGYDSQVNEQMNRMTFSLNGSPSGFALAYEGVLERFNNKAPDVLMGDYSANFAGATFNSASATKPLHFVPDSTLISNNLRFAKNYGSTAVAAGYGLSVLDQDSFTARQQLASYNVGRITTNSGYLNITSNVLSFAGLEGFVKYNNRDNGSTFPAVGLINPAADQQLGVRINQINSLSYGVAATFRPDLLKSSVAVGVKREDKDRDLTWSNPTILPAFGSIQPQRSLYKEKTVTDELYANWVARPAAGVVLRISPSYTAAAKTGQVTEPEKASNLKTKVSYVTNNGMLVGGYYNYKNTKNANNELFNSIANNVATTSVTQDVTKTQQAAGGTLNLPVSEWININAGLSWTQDDFASYYLSSDRRRFEQGVTNATTLNFLIRDRSNYKVDTYVIMLGGDWQVSDPIGINAAYTFTKSKGNTASGVIQSELPTVDGVVDNAVHSLILGGDYVLSKTIKIKGAYVYERYTDDSYTTLTGSYHSVVAGVSVGF